MDHPKLNKLAPNFKLLDQNGEDISLKSFKGKSHVLLYFYPKAMTPGCTVQACGIRDELKQFKKLNTIVLGLSPDRPERLLKFAEKEKLNFTLLSDPDHAVAELYGAWGRKNFMGREYDGVLRSTFLIGKDGKLLAVVDKVNTKTHHDDMLELIKHVT